MMIRPATLAAIARGEVDLAFRRWDRPRVVVGTRMRTAVGVLEVISVDRVASSRITAAEARRAGESSLAALRKALEAKQQETDLLKSRMRDYMEKKNKEAADWAVIKSKAL